jgi:hypothetical protein
VEVRILSTHHHAIRLHGLLKTLNENPGKAADSPQCAEMNAGASTGAGAGQAPVWGVSDEKHKVLHQGHR